MNREQRRKTAKAMGHAPQDRIVLTGVTAFFENGQHTGLDIGKIQIVDRETGAPLFEEMLEGQPQQLEAPASFDNTITGDAENYQVEFDTPEGRMVYVKNGNWSGVKPA